MESDSCHGEREGRRDLALTDYDSEKRLHPPPPCAGYHSNGDVCDRHLDVTGPAMLIVAKESRWLACSEVVVVASLGCCRDGEGGGVTIETQRTEGAGIGKMHNYRSIVSHLE